MENVVGNTFLRWFSRGGTSYFSRKAASLCLEAVCTFTEAVKKGKKKKKSRTVTVGFFASVNDFHAASSTAHVLMKHLELCCSEQHHLLSIRRERFAHPSRNITFPHSGECMSHMALDAVCVCPTQTSVKIVLDVH